MTIDLHVHSIYSDGSFSPAGLVELGSKNGLTALSITDHDTVEGIAEAKEAGKRYGVEIVSGVELSAEHQGYTMHILGYCFDEENISLNKGLAELQSDRVKRNDAILSILHANGVSIEAEELQKVSKTGLTGRPHIGQLLINKGIVRTMDEAFEKYLGRQGKAYVARSVYHPEKAISLIKQANGIAVLAHPFQVAREGANLPSVIRDLVKYGLDGIELYYPTHSKKKRKMLRGYANIHDLLVSGGSDFHGSVRPGTTMAWGRKFSVPARVLVEMKGYLLTNSKD